MARIAKPVSAGLAALLLALAPGVSAHSDATGVVKERMEMMKGLKRSMRAIGAMAKGASPYDGGKVASRARTMADIAGKLPAKFPKGTDGEPSEAKPEIWTQWDRFEALARDLERAAGGLAESGSMGDKAATAAGMDAVGKVCGACHRAFKKPDE